MKRIITTTLAIALIALTASAAKKKDLTIALDFTGENPFTAVAGETPVKPTLQNPTHGLAIPTKWVKTVEAAEELGYISCPNEEKGEDGFYLPYSEQSFKSNGQTYSIAIGTQRTPGRKAHLLVSKGTLRTAKVGFTFPKVEGMIPSGLRLYTVNNSKSANERYVFRIYKDKVSTKNEIAQTNPGIAEEDTLLEAKLDGVTEYDNLLVATYSSFNITKIEFLYKPVANKKK